MSEVVSFDGALAVFASASDHVGDEAVSSVARWSSGNASPGLDRKPRMHSTEDPHAIR